MYTIIDRTSLREEENFRIEITIEDDRDILEVNCLYPTQRRMAFDLFCKGNGGLITKRYYPGGSALKIPLAPYDADAFEFKACDENGKTVVVYKIVRSYCG